MSFFVRKHSKGSKRKSAESSPSSRGRNAEVSGTRSSTNADSNARDSSTYAGDSVINQYLSGIEYGPYGYQSNATGASSQYTPRQSRPPVSGSSNPQTGPVSGGRDRSSRSARSVSEWDYTPLSPDVSPLPSEMYRTIQPGDFPPASDVSPIDLTDYTSGGSCVVAPGLSSFLPYGSDRSTVRGPTERDSYSSLTSDFDSLYPFRDCETTSSQSTRVPIGSSGAPPAFGLPPTSYTVPPARPQPPTTPQAPTAPTSARRSSSRRTGGRSNSVAARVPPPIYENYESVPNEPRANEDCMVLAGDTGRRYRLHRHHRTTDLSSSNQEATADRSSALVTATDSLRPRPNPRPGTGSPANNSANINTVYVSGRPAIRITTPGGMQLEIAQPEPDAYPRGRYLRVEVERVESPPPQRPHRRTGESGRSGRSGRSNRSHRSHRSGRSGRPNDTNG